jgi:HK97 family phage major capsid protein
LNAEEKRMGLPVTKRDTSPLTREQRAQVREFQGFAEVRDTGGSIIPRVGTFTGNGNFVPTAFFKQVFEGLKQHDPIFDDANFTQIRSTNGEVMTLPTLPDTENDASVVGEAASRSQVNISAPSQAVLAVYSYASLAGQH